MELYFAWSLYKYVVVAVILALLVMVSRVMIPLIVTGQHNIEAWKKRVVWSGVASYVILVALSLNTGQSVLDADKRAWNAPVMEAPEIVVKPNTDKQETEDKLKQAAKELLDSVEKE